MLGLLQHVDVHWDGGGIGVVLLDDDGEVDGIDGMLTETVEFEMVEEGGALAF